MKYSKKVAGDKHSENKELWCDLHDGTISSIVRFAPDLIPNLKKSIRTYNDEIQINRKIFGGKNEFIPLDKSVLVMLRYRLEELSKAKYGTKLRIDRPTIEEYLTMVAGENKIYHDWLTDIPVWDGIDHLTDLARQQDDVYPSKDELISFYHKRFYRAFFTIPIARKMSVSIEEPVLPIIVHQRSEKNKAAKWLDKMVKGGDLIESSASVITEQHYAESLDLNCTHAISPNLMQYSAFQPAERERFLNLIRNGSVFYRKPNIGASEGARYNLPLIIGLVDANSDAYDRLQEIDRLSIGWISPIFYHDIKIDKDTINQCYAQAFDIVQNNEPMVFRMPKRLMASKQSESLDLNSLINIWSRL